MKKTETKFYANPYSEIFRGEVSEYPMNDSNNNLLGFTVYYSSKDSEMSKDELLDKIVELSPPPHSIYPDEEGFLARFELSEPIYIENDEHEDKLRKDILRFFEKNNVVQGELQEMEIGRWVTQLAIPDDREVRE